MVSFLFRKKIAIAASTGLLGLLGYPAIKSVYPIKPQISTIDDYVDLPTATADLTKDILLPEGIGTGTDVPVDISHWLLLTLLNSKNVSRKERALAELATQRRWNDAECVEIAQALDHANIIKLARTPDADLCLFLSPPSNEVISRTLQSDHVEAVIKEILKDVMDKIDDCSSCANFYTNLSIRFRPDPNLLAMNDLDQLDRVVRSRKRPKSEYQNVIIKLKAILNNVICSEAQAYSMAQSGLLFVLLFFRNKYPDDKAVNSLLAQILANFSVYESTKENLFLNGWIKTLLQYSRSEYLELSLPAAKALTNLDIESVKENGIYDNHIYLLHPQFRHQGKEEFDVIFIHGLVGSVFKSWRQGTVPENETTELLPEPTGQQDVNLDSDKTEFMKFTRCWPKDWLANDVDNLRVLAVDYPTALSNWRTDCDINKDNLEQRAKLVMKQLEMAKVGSRPIVWVTHSMGGLLVKQILVSSYESLNDTNNNVADKKNNRDSINFCKQLLDQTKGVVFYSVPHRGSNLDWIERKNLQKILMLTTEVIELQKDSPTLLNLQKKFNEVVEDERYKDIKFISFLETGVSSFGVNKVVQWTGVLVHDDSLTFQKGPSYKLNIDHAHSCKPSSRKSITYTKTLELIKTLSNSDDKRRKDENILPLISFTL